MIYTGYFDRLAFYQQNGLVPICIAGYAPAGFSGMYYKSLAPKKIWWQEWHDKKLGEDWYSQKYSETVLSELNPERVAHDFRMMGDNVVLLCYEKPPAFCHRHLVARWFQAHRIKVCEYQHINQ